MDAVKNSGIQPPADKPVSVKKKKIDAVNWIIFVFVVLGAYVMLYPLLWMLSTSVKAVAHVYNTGLIPVEWHFGNYANAFRQAPLLRGIRNSLLVAVPVVSISILTATMAAFAFAKLKFKFKNFFFFLLLGSTMVPFAVYMLPQVVLFKQLGLLNGLMGRIIPGLAGGAFTIFFLRQFLYGIPDSVIEGAKIDGAGFLRIFFQIICPLAAPAIIAQVILGFIGNWNDYLGPLLFIPREEWYTIPLVIAKFNAGGATDNSIPLLMAGSLVSLVPVLVVFAIFQKKIVNSVMLSGGKL